MRHRPEQRQGALSLLCEDVHFRHDAGQVLLEVLQQHARQEAGEAYVDALQLSLEAFDGAAPDAERTDVTSANVHHAVLLGCRRRLLGMRRGSFEALSRGFTRAEDLQVQLGAFSLEALSGMLQGKERLSVDELLACFELPRSSGAREAAQAGFEAHASQADAHFESVLRDEARFDEGLRLRLLKWCTALGALPVGGLPAEHRIRLRLYGPEVDTHTLPETHTCTRELHLPNYPNVQVTREKILMALAHADDGFLKE